MNKRILISLLVLLALAMRGQEAKDIGVQTFTYRDTLQLDFYSLSENTEKNRTLIVLVHGGGFSGGTRDGFQEKAFCESMARKGFAVASISYRLTRKSEKFGCDCPAGLKLETFVKASEDLSDAVGFLIDSEQFRFDRESVILAGSSAGAETVLSTAFMAKHYAFRHIVDRKYAGVVSLAGALIDANYITRENVLPVMMFHGAKDELVPFESDAHHFCDAEAPGYLILDGSRTIAKRLYDLQSTYILVTDPDGGHDIAGRSLGQTDLIANFIEDLVIDHKFVQQELPWTDPETTTPTGNRP